MELYEVWKKLEAEQLLKPIDWKEIKKPEDFHSRHPALKLQHSLKISMGFAISFILLFALLIPFFSPWEIKFLLSLVVAGYGFFLWINYRTYKQVTGMLGHALTHSVKDALQQIHTVVYRSIRFQEKSSVLFYPLSIVAGFLVGLFLGAPEKFKQSLQEWNTLMLLVITILILTPLTYYAARWLYRHSYDKYLNELQALIRAFDN